MSDSGQRHGGPAGMSDSVGAVSASEVDRCPRCDLRLDTCPAEEHEHAFAWDIAQTLAGGLDCLEAWCDTPRLRSRDTVGWKLLTGFVQHPQDEARRLFLWDEGVMVTTRDDLVPVRWT